MALSAAVERRFGASMPYADQPIRQAANTVIYKGGALSPLNAGDGTVAPLVAGEIFCGFAMEDSVATGIAEGVKTVLTRLEGFVWLNVTGVSAVTSTHAKIYASDDGTFTLTSTSNTLIGKIVYWDSGTLCLVHFQADSQNDT